MLGIILLSISVLAKYIDPLQFPSNDDYLANGPHWLPSDEAGVIAFVIVMNGAWWAHCLRSRRSRILKAAE
ncbi:hypothetical protein CU102_24675 [Phyllobacterium brassicacearum]|uniref:Uncharacterized protein n=1 Tax=Phyllobacterium brassicacearum TaxID=314235 RepID=A0A2P7B902_9HYPH|nr:hypothetical protein CU102_24675 [Phyllobacterium brassicacearum]